MVQLANRKPLPSYEVDEDLWSKDRGHKQTSSPLGDLVIQGDNRQAMARMPEGSVHLTFTSPPYYNAREYSTYATYDEYLELMAATFAEVHRITAEGRFLIVNTSPVLTARESRAHQSVRHAIPYDLHPLLRKQGWDFIDDIVWMKPEPSAKNRVAGFSQHRKPLGYKPNPITEMLMVYRKHTDRLIDWNMRQYSPEVTAQSLVPEGYETSNVWQIPPTRDSVHSAVFPLGLCARVIQYYSYKGDLVLDPFAGSGTLGMAANRLGREFLLLEQQESYVNRMKTMLPFHTQFMAVAEIETYARNNT